MMVACHTIYGEMGDGGIDIERDVESEANIVLMVAETRGGIWSFGISLK